MNCNHFRFLIQQSFDVELTPQDEQLVTSHIESCHACALFQHQLNQIVQSASGLFLSAEYQPENLEKLSQLISRDLPRPKMTALSGFSNLFAGIIDSITNAFHTIASLPQKIYEKFSSSKAQSIEESEESLQDRTATTSRLRGLSRFYTQESQMSPEIKSLGEKFGIAQAPVEPPPPEENPSNLAESIRRRLVDEKLKQEPIEPIKGATWEQAVVDAQPPISSDQPITWGQLPESAQPAPGDDQAGWSGKWDEPPVETGFVTDNVPPSKQADYPASSSPTSEPDSQFDIPIQQQSQTEQSGQPSSIPTDSIINRLSNVLSESSPTNQGDLASRFDIPIQERKQTAPASPTASPPPPTTPPIPPVTPPAAAPPPSATPPIPSVASQAPAPPADHWDIPIQEKLRKSSGQPAASAPPAAQESSLFKNLDDSAMDRLFNENLGVAGKSESAPSSNASPAMSFSPPPTSAPPEAAQNIAVPAEDQSGGIFKNLDDSAMDKLFSQNLGVSEQVINKQVKLPASPSVTPPSAPLAVTPPPPVKPKEDSLFAIDDNTIDKIFADNLGVKDNTALSQSFFSAAPPKDEPAAGAQPSEPVKVEGIGKLDRKVEAPSEGGSGKIAAIGKFLLDQQDWAKIGDLTKSDLNETKMRILTLEAAQEVQTLLQHVGTQPGVVGSVIVGHDGILIANSMPPELDPESTGIWALGIYLNTSNTIKKLGHNQVHQIVAKTAKGYLIIADFGGGILVTLTDGAETEKLIPLMRSITQLVAN